MCIMQKKKKRSSAKYAPAAANSVCNDLRSRVQTFLAWPTFKVTEIKILLFFNIASFYFNTIFTSVN